MFLKYKAWIIVSVLLVMALLNYLDRLMVTTMGDSIRNAIFESLPPLPDVKGRSGCFTGVSGDSLIVAGGSDHADVTGGAGMSGVPHDEVYALRSPDSKTWRMVGRLPKPLAYGVSVTSGGSLICIGGFDSNQCVPDVFRLSLSPSKEDLKIERLPPLPVSLAWASGGIAGSRIYVLGGKTDPMAVTASASFYALDIDCPQAGWTQLPPCPGEARILAGSASLGGGICFAGGGAVVGEGLDGQGANTVRLKDAWRFEPSTGQWSRMGDMPHPLMGMPSPTAPGDDGKFIFWGGDDGSAPSAHAGFSSDVIRYDASKDDWRVIGEMPQDAGRVATAVVSWRGRYVIPCGETGVGVCTSGVSGPMTNRSFGLLTSVFLWVYALFSPLGGYLADRIGRSVLIIGSLAIWSLVTFITGLVDSVNAMIVTRAAMGISEAFYMPAALALIADYHDGSTRSTATGIHMTGLHLGTALGGVGGILAETYGWRSGFYILGGLGLAYMIIPALILRDIPRKESETARDLSADEPASPMNALLFLCDKSFLALLGYFTLLSMTSWVIIGWLPVYLQERFHLNQGAAGFSATSCTEVASFGGILIGGLLADRLIRRTPYGRILIPSIGCIVAAPLLFASTLIDLFWIAILGFMIFGLARGFSSANQMPILCQVIDPRCRATGYGVMNALACVMGGVMIYATGILKDVGVELTAVFQIATLFAMLAGCMLLFAKPKYELNLSRGDL